MERRRFLRSIATATLAARFSAELSPEKLVDAAQDPGLASPNLNGTNELFYRPARARAGDVIPFYDGKTCRIFHLHRDDKNQHETSWYQVSTNDFVHYTDHGEMIPQGGREDQDHSVATGSVIRGEGRYHSFYTGYRVSPESLPKQGIMHAVSDDLLNWEKVPGSTFYAPEAVYERNDWRDPFVFWNDEAREYWMLAATRLRSGPARRRGCTALCVSKDLFHWETREPFWAPHLYVTHECPDLFRIGDWWYLIFSEFSEGHRTRYRMSRKVAGPWIAPEDDGFDTRAFYAAKTCFDGRHRYLVGWNPVRSEAKDDGKWEWGGSLAAHELIQQPSGVLKVQIIKSVSDAFQKRVGIQPQTVMGTCNFGPDAIGISAPGTFGAATLAPMPARCKFTANIQFSEETRACGLMLKLGDDLDSGYYVRLEPAKQRVVFDLWPRPGDQPFMAGMERPVKLTPGMPTEIVVIADGTIAEVYVAGQVALSTRMYSKEAGKCGLFVNEGAARFKNVAILEPIVS